MILTEALDSLSEEAESLALRVSWNKTKVQAFGDILDAITESIPGSGENVKVSQSYIYVGSVLRLSAAKRNQSTGASLECDEFAGRRYVVLPILVQKDEGPSFSLAGPSSPTSFLRDLDSD